MANYTIGPKIGLDGEADFRKSLNNINNGLRTYDSELKKVSSSFSENAKSEEALRAKNEVLNKSIAAQEKKITEVKKALEYSKGEYGANADQTLKWQRVLNNAETDLNNLRNEVSKNDKALVEMKNAVKDNDNAFDDLEDSVDKANENLDETTKISTKVVAAGELIADGLKAAGRAAVELGKETIENYANYEQQVGGIKTLFGAKEQSLEEYAESVGKSVTEAEGEYNRLIQSENQVFSNANDAYKTAGITANAYMELSTSFAASLLQSLDGDTKAAAETTNMAIIDMSDNANKMGTEMSDIENAYKGFAKQNYTMLDNLKLGYGGTKQEMQRLLQDAEKISGVKYNIDNLNDVYTAIHVVQGELGITGTTAKEASETISGSANAMKSAWENLTVGIVDENANLEQLMDNFSDSVFTFMDNLLPKIITGLEHLPTMLVGLVDRLVPVGTEILIALVNGLVNSLPKLVEAALNIIITLINTLIENTPALVTTVVDIFYQLVEILTDPDMLVSLIMAAIVLLVALADGLVNNFDKLVAAVPLIIENLITAILKLLPELVPVAIDILSTLASALGVEVKYLTTIVPDIIDALFCAFSNVFSEARGWGQDFMQNIIDGIRSMISNLRDSVLDVASVISNYLHFSIPDKGPLRDVPNWMPDMIDLLVGGIEDNEYRIANAAKSLAEVVNDEMAINANVRNVGYGDNVIVLNSTTNLDGVAVANSTQRIVTNQQTASNKARGVA